MKAVFIHARAVLRDSHIDPDNVHPTSRLAPATLEAVRLLGAGGALVFLYGALSGDGATWDEPAVKAQAALFNDLVAQIEAGGGRVDGLVTCEHRPTDACQCWGATPGVLWLPALQFEFRLDACYVVGDDARDVLTSRAAGARPLIILGDRTIGQVLGNDPVMRGFPVAGDLRTAMEYISAEEEITAELGHPLEEAPPVPSQEALYAEPAALPRLAITSERAQRLRTGLVRARAHVRDTMRWLTFLVLGALGVSLGIAYLLTHLYRVTPFPAYFYYLTLQFIPRTLRGALFIALGIGIVVFAVRSLARSSTLWPRRRAS